jgi:hypothetical protein
MKKLVFAFMVLTLLTGCWWSPTHWDEAEQRASCEKSYPDDAAAAKKCYDTAYLGFERDKAKQTNDLMK